LKQGTLNKHPLKQNLFIFEFEYGVAGEGYWSYQHMVLQLEDCVDVLKILYPHFDFLFLFDHSCGHDKQREDGLIVENMSKRYGGQQAMLCTSTIKQQHGYLGPYSHTLKCGDEQSMIFKQQDVGPFWMSEQECEEKRHDKIIEGETVKQKLKKELIEKLW